MRLSVVRVFQRNQVQRPRDGNEYLCEAEVRLVLIEWNKQVERRTKMKIGSQETLFYRAL